MNTVSVLYGTGETVVYRNIRMVSHYKDLLLLYSAVGEPNVYVPNPLLIHCVTVRPEAPEDLR